ncbi:hypothetical protein [Spirosoma areae]
MIAITNDQGLRLTLPADQSMTLERSAGWMADDVLPGAKSYPIEFPVQPNEAFLQSGYRPGHARPRMEFPVTVRLAGVLYRRCLLNYRITEGKGTGYLKIDGGEVFSQLKKLSLADALPDEVVLTSFFLDPLVLKLKAIAAMAPGEFPCTFFPIRNEGFFEPELDATKLPGFVRQPYVNAWGPLPGGGYGFLLDSDTIKGYPISPQFYLTWVLQRIFARAGYRIDGDWIADEEVQRLVILNQTAISSKSPGLFSGVVSSVIAGQHVPKLNVGDFLKIIRQRYGLLYDFDGNLQTVTIRRFTDVVRTPARDLTPYIAGKWGIESPASRGFSIVDGIDAADELYKDSTGASLVPVGLAVGGGAIGAERDEVKLGVCATQLMYEPSGMSGGNWMVPTLRQAGNILDLAYKDTDRYPESPKPGETQVTLKYQTALRIISYRGMVQSSNGSLYPLGTPDVNDGRQVQVGTKAAMLGGRRGEFRRVLRAFYYFRDQTRSVTVPLDLPVGIAAGLKLHEPIALKLDGQARRTYLIDKLQAESPGPSGIMPCKLFALSLPDGLDQAADNDEPVVWIELKRVTTAQQPIGNQNVSGYEVYSTLTLLAWTDAQRSAPATVAGLLLSLRKKQQGKSTLVNLATVADTTYVESVDYYTLPSASVVLEPNLLVETRLINHVRDITLLDYKLGISLDPGEGYNILT